VFSPDGQSILLANKNGEIRCLDRKMDDLTRQIIVHENLEFDTLFASSGTTFVTAHDCAVKLWELNTGQFIRKFELPVSASALTISMDGKFIATSSSEGSLTILECASGKLVKKYRKGNLDSPPKR
jgi:WD40 repeat protein